MTKCRLYWLVHSTQSYNMQLYSVILYCSCAALSAAVAAALLQVPSLMAAGVHCFKIEGRLKGPEYVAATTQVGELHTAHVQQVVAAVCKPWPTQRHLQLGCLARSGRSVSHAAGKVPLARVMLSTATARDGTHHLRRPGQHGAIFAPLPYYVSPEQHPA
jgi:collagenase-like PrtC family protease